MNAQSLNDLLSASGLTADSDTRTGLMAAAEQGNAPELWRLLSTQLLTRAHPFALHHRLYEFCYGSDALFRAPGPAWFPRQRDIARSNIAAVLTELQLDDFRTLHRWSIENRQSYWGLAISQLGIQFEKPFDQLLDATVAQRPRWLIGAELNIVRTCVASDSSRLAVIESNGIGPDRTTTYGELAAVTARVAGALRAGGIAPGDAVAMIMPMTAAAVATYLGVIAVGAAVVSIPDSFASAEIAVRVRLGGARLVFTQDVVHWGAKRIDLYDKVKQASSLPTVVLVQEGRPCSLRAGDLNWHDFLAADDRLDPVPRAPADAINILFSSGTTGEPKAIPWDQITPIKCAADAHFHHDLHPGDVACWWTNLGWMMGPWLIFATLINRGTIALYAQAPHERGFGEFVERAGVTMLGCVPSLVRAWRQSDCMRGLDWSRIRAFSSTGECSNPADSLYLMHLAGYRPVIEYCGGTEIGGAYLTSTVVQPNIPSCFTTPALGLDIVLADANGTLLDEAAGGIPDPAENPSGEAFLIGPSIGLSTRLLNRDHEAVYYKDTPRHPRGMVLRRHGDELERLADGAYRVAGRSDDTMNLGGIKVGCAEIERALSGVPGVLETAAVAVPPPGGGPSRLVIFAVLDPSAGTPTLEELKRNMQGRIRERLNPLFGVNEVRVIPALPRTASNKVMRRMLREQIAKD